MSRILRFVGLWSLCLGLTLAAAYASRAIAEPTKTPIPAQVTQIDDYPFPAKIAGLSRKHKIDYNETGLGFSVRYEIPSGTWADIFIYDLGKDLTSANVGQASADQREAAIGDIERAASAGSYQAAKLIAKAATPPYAKAHVTITQRGITRDSYVFVTISRKNFVKIRYTTLAKNAEQMADKFAAEYARLLSNKPQ